MTAKGKSARACRRFRKLRYIYILLIGLLLASLGEVARASGGLAPKPAKKSTRASKGPQRGARTPLKPASVKPQPVAEPVVRVTFEDLGFKDGLVVEEMQHSQTMFFPIPRDLPLKGARLELTWRASEMLSPPSNFRVSVNGVPRVVVPLTNRPIAKLSLPLEPRVLRKRFVEVKVNAALIVSGNLCVDEAAKGGYLNILRESSMEFVLERPDVKSIRGFWQSLPPQVTISLSSTLGSADTNAFYAAWLLGTTLTSFGKQVRFERLPAIGHIVVASGREIDKLTEERGMTRGNVGLIRSRQRVALAIREPYHVGQITVLDRPWIELTRGAEYLFHPLPKDARTRPAVLPVRLADLGVTDTHRVFRGNAEWAFYQRARQLPAGYQPRQLFLDVVSNPGQMDQPVSIYVYVNNRLLEVLRLASHGKPQQFTVPLPPDAVRSDNRFRIVAQRVDSQGNCEKGGLIGNYSVQILPESGLLTEPAEDPPERLSQLISYFGDDFDVFLPAGFLQKPERALAFLSRLSWDVGVFVADAARIRFYQPREKLSIARSFVVVGRPGEHPMKAAVLFERGGVQVTEKDGKVVLDVDQLPGVTIAQVARVGSHRGLWISESESDEPPATDAIATADGDLIFLDRAGALLTLDSRRTLAARVVQRGTPGWFAMFGAWRYWLLAAGWIIATMLFLQLYRKVQKHRTAS